MKPDKQQLIFENGIALHRGLLFKVVRAYAFNSHDQDDLFQEIATQLWNSVPGYRGDCAGTTWIYRVALYSAMGWSKKENRHRDNQRTLLADNRLLLQQASPENPQLEWLFTTD